MKTTILTLTTEKEAIQDLIKMGWKIKTIEKIYNTKKIIITLEK